MANQDSSQKSKTSVVAKLSAPVDRLENLQAITAILAVQSVVATLEPVPGVPLQRLESDAPADAQPVSVPDCLAKALTPLVAAEGASALLDFIHNFKRRRESLDRYQYCYRLPDGSLRETNWLWHFMGETLDATRALDEHRARFATSRSLMALLTASDGLSTPQPNWETVKVRFGVLQVVSYFSPKAKELALSYREALSSALIDHYDTKIAKGANKSLAELITSSSKSNSNKRFRSLSGPPFRTGFAAVTSQASPAVSATSVAAKGAPADHSGFISRRCRNCDRICEKPEYPICSACHLQARSAGRAGGRHAQGRGRGVNTSGQEATVAAATGALLNTK